MLASHLIMRGMVEEGLTIVRAARRRHDGSRRNPWNDIECGSYYSRALSSYALVNAYSGLTFDARVGEIGFKPVGAGDGVYFWSAGRGWGEIHFHGRTAALIVKGGALSVARLRFPTLSGAVLVDGAPARRDGDAIVLAASRQLKTGDRLVVEEDSRG
jgi:non-lysosomal glucosylceramidase